MNNTLDNTPSHPHTFTPSLFADVYAGKKVIITGDTGFKGSWLAIWLLNLGASVVGYALPPKTKKDNYLICGLDKKVIHIDGDIRDYQTLLGIFSKYEPEIVFHLAAQSLVLDSYNDPLYTYSTNVMGTVNLLEAVRHTPSVKVAINVTSDKCYENREWVYGYRETDPMGGRDPYSSSKGASEIITSSYWRSFFSQDNTANIASARAGNVIGGGDWADDRIFPDCMRSLLNNKPIAIRNPEAVRPWQHVLEPLSGYLLLGSLLYTEGKKYSAAWNFGPLSKSMVSVRQLVEETIKQWGSGRYIIEHSSDSTPEAGLLHLDISKAVSELNWHPVLDFKQTVKFSIDEYRVDRFTSREIFNQRIKHIKKYIELRQKI
ncbi:CDP-glucose 4,6-dehydratase [Thermodesulfovibrionales bacterium]|nr:CDP-glucose 4,6-dehydratase [Thermodesulfovibrionales bacterium]MCL0047361.1 CDP-glucose 4,6-dehydratase [Thermodesulfovibrionales bacterium]MCL0084855.1 CDP-glucose 4,6-dehydratase [Thermodesulfovibrionales bacterium]MCL0087014.1 CDP-glucose 4,6-dehydratase [Thermodesulfovibrionales bacterium]